LKYVASTVVFLRIIASALLLQAGDTERILYMKYGITLLGNRVSPRCTYADSILFVSQTRNGIGPKKRIPANNLNLPDLCDLLLQNRVDTLVCGGITGDCKEFLRSRNLAIIDNVACTVDRIIQALQSGKLRQGFGFSGSESDYCRKIMTDQHQVDNSDSVKATEDNKRDREDVLDCLSCTNRVCLDGKVCETASAVFNGQSETNSELAHMLDAAIDIASEKERTLCRLSELIYFCLEMQYERLGIAYCLDLEEPTEILARVLRRFFTVFPVCCKVGGLAQNHPQNTTTRYDRQKTDGEVSCNPWGQAQVLNGLNTDLNIMVGLCMGADCIFMQASQAPATGLFIKDKSLANNPIGAVYSEFYLKEAVQAHS
jgi:uncharacterized metal-binding protein/predicted Fe-Mo cluster-binding NifX family protein